MAQLEDILSLLRAAAPEAIALPGDPVGLLIGQQVPQPVTNVGVCLDATSDVVQRAQSVGCQLIVAHHPLIYRPLARINAHGDPISRIVGTLCAADIALYAMHTNWDRAAGGINDVLAAQLGVTDAKPLSSEGEGALARIGTLANAITASEWVNHVAEALRCSGTSAIRHTRIADGGGSVRTVAVCGGAGGSLAAAARNAGADAFVTSDVRHHEFLDAAERGLLLVDAGHYATEAPGMKAVATLLQASGLPCRVHWLG